MKTRCNNSLLYAILIMLALPVFCISCNTHATPSSISISISGSPSVTLTSTAEGRFADSGDSTITITTNHAAGYTLTAKASKSTSLEGTNGGSIPSISTAVTPANYADSTYAASNNLNDTWGYKPSIYNSSANTNYLPSPGLGTAQSPVDTLAVTNNANDGSYTVSIGTRITTATAIDSYGSGFVFAVTGNPTSYAITYNKNTTDTVTNMPTNHTTSDSGANGETVTIDSTVPVRDGYNFKGWCSTTTSDDTCSGTVYNPDGGGTALSLTIDQTSATNAFILYAMWKNARCDDTLYNCIATAWANEGSRVMTNDADTNTGIQAAITKSNSGVFKYNPSTFGTSSDASNNYDIYFYRGILDKTTGSYGSDGDNAAHPNTVLLDANSNGADTSDTCWRIVRTTGSGGVKMIYNGLYGATTAGTCANTETNAQVATSVYNGTSSTYRRIALVGYTYNPTYGDANVTTSTSVDDVFGNNSNYSANSSNSIIKGYIENTWFSNISAYESILEPSAGYCNDRTAYSDDTTSTALSTIVPYVTSNDSMYFGAYGRNINATNAGKTPSLTCPSNRNVVDLYTTSSASNGNKQLTKPAALLTVDEVSLAGSGRSTASDGSAYHANSFLRSGSAFWLLSPYNRDSYGVASEFILTSVGRLGYNGVSNSRGVRPAISLTSGTTAASGSGTATDPWVVAAPPTMQDFAAGTTSTTCSSMSEGDTITLADSRDGEQYLVGKLADDKCWMLENLNLAGGTALSADNTDVTSAYVNSFTTSKNLTKLGNTIVLPASSTSGFDIVNYSYVYNSGNKTTSQADCTSSQPCNSYYSWDAATLGSGRNISTDNTDAAQSICPKGWKLPSTYGGSGTAAAATDFRALMIGYGGSDSIRTYDSSTIPTGGTMYSRIGPGSTPNFLCAGYYKTHSFYYGGSYGFYWSSTTYSNDPSSNVNSARYLYFYSFNVDSARDNYRSFGYSVRCLLSE